MYRSPAVEGDGCLSDSVRHRRLAHQNLLLSAQSQGSWFSQPAVCTAPEYRETCSLKSSLSSYSSCMLYLNPFIFTWLHMIIYIQDVAFIHHKIKDSSEHEEKS